MEGTPSKHPDFPRKPGKTWKVPHKIEDLPRRDNREPGPRHCRATVLIGIDAEFNLIPPDSVDVFQDVFLQVLALEKVLSAEPDMAARVSAASHHFYLTAEFLHITET